MPNIFDSLTKTSGKKNIFSDLTFKGHPSQKHGAFERAAVNIPQSVFRGAVSSIPGAAELAKQASPFIEYAEQQAKPSFLPSSGLEPAAEKGLLNLLSLLGSTDVVKNLTPQALKDRFKETTGGQFEPQTPGERIGERGAELFGAGLGMGQVAPSLAASGVAGQGLRELGAPEPVASLAEIATPFASAALSKSFNALSAADKALVKTAQNAGVTESQIAAIMKTPKWQKTLANYSSKSSAAEQKIRQTFDKLGDVYADLKLQGREYGRFSPNNTQRLIDKWEDVLDDLQRTHRPSPDKQAAIGYVEDALENIRNFGSDPEKIINTLQDVNSVVNWNAIKGGKKQLAALKEPAVALLKKEVPAIANEYENTNKLYGKSVELAKALSPSTLEELIGQGKVGSVALGLATFQPNLLYKALGFVAGRKAVEQMLFSPRFNAMGKKMFAALKKNDRALANRILQDFTKAVKEEFPDQEIDLEELEL